MKRTAKLKRLLDEAQATFNKAADELNAADAAYFASQTEETFARFTEARKTLNAAYGLLTTTLRNYHAERRSSEQTQHPKGTHT